MTRAQLEVRDDGSFEALQVSATRTAIDLSGRSTLPNLVEVMARLLEHATPPLRLTRRTLLELFRRSNDQAAAMNNPHEFARAATRILKEKLADHLIDDIQYIRTNESYEMRKLLEEEEVELFCKYVVPTGDDKALHDRVACDSEIEKKFVEDLERLDDVRLYLKLPPWFVVPTPLGDYRPGWAIVIEGPENEDTRPVLYLVAETKSSTRETGLRPDGWRKIKCGAAHFGSQQFKKKGALEEIDFKAVSSAAEL